ncbi:hypothetical protein VTO58DRAFT_101845 [Aureobasidium pullulans]
MSDVTATKGLLVYENTEYFAALDSGLLTLHGTIGPTNNVRKVQFTLDTAASSVYISASKARSFWKSSIIRIPPKTIVLPNGNTLVSTEGIQLPYSIGNWHNTLEARLVDFEGYDVILGLSWFIRHNPSINWQIGSVTLLNEDSLEPQILKSHSKIFNLKETGEQDVLAAFAELATPPFATKAKARRRLQETALLYLIALKMTDLSPPEEEQQLMDPLFNQALKGFPSVFREELPKGLPKNRGVIHIIETGDAKPINTQAYQLNPQQLQEQQKQIEMLLQHGLIRESSSPWGSPVLFVPKPDNKWRMCVDFRALNLVTKKNGYPLPRVQDCLDAFAKAVWFTKLDLVSGFWQLLMDPGSVAKTAFNTIYGKYEFLVMPFGLCNAPATFQTLMNRVLRPFLWKTCVVYLDDILIFSKSKREHAQHLQQVFAVLQQEKLFTSEKKCVIGVQKVEFCGHLITPDQTRPLQDKLNIIRTWPTPSNAQQVRQFLGLASYYRRYIQGFAKLAAPLSDLLKEEDADLRAKKRRPISWNAQCTVSFKTLKEALATGPVLVAPDKDKPYTVETDASEWAIGSVLYQEGQDNKLHPVAFGGRKLRNAELNYPVHEKEGPAIKEALRQWEHYIQNGFTTVILTDHESLKYLQTMKTPSKRVARWFEEFSEFDIDIRYRKGSEAIVPDALSRRPDFMGTIPANVAERINAMRFKSDEDEAFVEGMITFKQTKVLPNDPHLQQLLQQKSNDFLVSDEDGIPVLKYRVANDKGLAPYLEPALRADFLEHMHNHYGHFGAPGLLGHVESRAWWPSMQRDIRYFGKHCPVCQITQKKSSKENETAFHQVNVELQPFERWALDVVGPLPPSLSGKQYVITAIDYATNWPIARAVESADDETTAEFVYEEIYCAYGAPREILSDNGANFVSRVVQHLCNKLRSLHRLSTPYHPRANGKNENLNGILGGLLTKMCVGNEMSLWESFLPEAIFHCRSRIHSGTGFSPFYLVYGQHPRIVEDENQARPLDISVADPEKRQAVVKHARHLANEKLLQKAIQAKLVNSQKLEEHKGPAFKENEWVLLQNPKPTKLVPKWTGPYQILKAHWLGTYALKTPEGRVLRHLMHGNRLTKAHCNSAQSFWNKPNPAIERLEVKPTSPEVLDALDSEEHDVPDVKTWSTLSEADWRLLQNFAPGQNYRAGARRFLVGEREKNDMDSQISHHVELSRRRKDNRSLKKKPISPEDARKALAVRKALATAEQQREQHEIKVLDDKIDQGKALAKELINRQNTHPVASTSLPATTETVATEPSSPQEISKQLATSATDLDKDTQPTGYSLRKNRTLTKRFG